MKKYILLAAILTIPNIAWAAATESAAFNNMNCTQAVTWAASQIASPPPPNFTPEEWFKFVSNGGAETIAIQLLSALPNSPCNTIRSLLYPGRFRQARV